MNKTGETLNGSGLTTARKYLYVVTLKNGQRRIHESSNDPGELQDRLMTDAAVVGGVPSWVVFNSGVVAVAEVADISLYPSMCANRLNEMNEGGKGWDLWSALELLNARENPPKVRALQSNL